MRGWARSAAVMASEKPIAVDGERSAGRQPMRVAHLHDERAGAPHLGMQKADGVRFRVVGAEGIRADKLGKAAGLVCRRHHRRPHFMQHDRHAGFGELPGSFRSGKAGTDYMDGILRNGHVPGMRQTALERQGRRNAPT